VNLHIHDLPGDPEYNDSNKDHYKDACVAIIMASYHDKTTLDECDEMIVELFDNMPKDCVPILIANKEDLNDRAFDTDGLIDLGEKHRIDLVFEVSVKTDNGMDDVMYEAACHANHFKESFL